MLKIERYGNTRHWAVYDGHELVVVTLYKRGAQEVLRRLQALAPPAPAVAPAAAAPTPVHRGHGRTAEDCLARTAVL
jgi:hypothetical protein